ncbi:RimK domain protein ATP-grasp [Psychromonas ingrahamii 37]|uniref:RimK domain protein ATP-grasp n=1 Tax=Psychromonas ingrahamii (strain DSM 17664 / CCUG 51855 / 37) TaxID=357804 RepID=A1SXH4_PSYIN|nr:hypothetical protein [Psychromonas ingrahamii]ABM04189.1 RimK domain protein ATP-grasp [Psychromonas ingrahamii 37]
MKKATQKSLPKIGLLYLDHVLRFFDKSNFKGWPDKIESVVYHWRNDKQRFIKEVKRKNIEVLIGNVPATAYETFREISRALPNVQFIPSLDTQFANKSKENVTQLCEKYNIPIPKTKIFYEPSEVEPFFKKTVYPKIIKKSYGPSNYGGYFVHKVDSYQEATALLSKKKYYPVYTQDFVPMAADIRVMLIGHKPVCAFWRRPPAGEWLTNTSQGGSMDYMKVPQAVLDLAVSVSKVANAEYWACDVAVGVDGKYRILECATAFAAFPYIRDWIGQYLMWKFSAGQFHQPHIPLYNWEELCKISAHVLRTMRYITFGREVSPSCDSGEMFTAQNDDNYPIINTIDGKQEEWPSEVWNRQDNYCRRETNRQVATKTKLADECSFLNKSSNAPSSEDSDESPALNPPLKNIESILTMTVDDIEFFLMGINGIGKKHTELILQTLGVESTYNSLQGDGSHFYQVKNIKEKKVARIMEAWQVFKLKFNY